MCAGKLVEGVERRLNFSAEIFANYLVKRKRFLLPFPPGIFHGFAYKILLFRWSRFYVLSLFAPN